MTAPSPTKPNRKPATRGFWSGAWRVIVCSILLIALDMLMGPKFAVSLFFVLPVIWAAWYQGFRFACILAVVFSVARFVCHWSHEFPLDFNPALINNVLRSLMMILVAFLTEQLAAQLRHLRARNKKLEAHLPICPSCGLACRDDDQWVVLTEETHLSKNRTPRLCPECERKLYD